MKKRLCGFFFAAVFAALAFGCRQPIDELSVAAFQKKYLLAADEAAKNKVVEQLERYYSNLAVPESLRQRVEDGVAQQLADTTGMAPVPDLAATNVYQLEKDLQNLLTRAAVARARDDQPIFKNLLLPAQDRARIVDAGTGNNYWQPFVEQVRLFTKAQALAWLKVKKAERLAYTFQDSTHKRFVAEYYVALGLKYLAKVNDARLRLDLLQRLQWVYYFHYSYFDLAIALAKKNLPVAASIKHYLRVNGLLYVQAESFFESKKNQPALASFDTIRANARRYKDIASIDWCVNPSLLRKIDIYTELGAFAQAWKLWHETAERNLTAKERMWLYQAKSNLLVATAHFDQAKAELAKALALADSLRDTENRIRYINTMGAFYTHLSDHGSALAYFQQAQAEFTPTIPSAVTRLLVLANIANVLSVKRDSAQFWRQVKDIEQFQGQKLNPYRQSYFFSILGKWHEKKRDYLPALRYYARADSVAEQNGFLDDAAQRKIKRVECLIQLARLSEAGSLLAEIEKLARQIDDPEIQIAAYDLRAQINYREGHIAQAAEDSRRMLQKIDTVSVQSRAHLMAYRHKIYDHYKRDVLYTLAQKNRAAAYARLDQVKADVLIQRLANGYRSANLLAANSADFSVDALAAKLPAKSVLLNYMLMPDSLYLFVLTNGRLQLLRKKIDMDLLQQMTQAFRDSINQTFRHFNPYSAPRINANYSGATASGQQLDRALLDWPELAPGLKQAEQLYIVPDEFLYELPFAALLSDPANPQTFLVNQAAISTLPSTTLVMNAGLSNGASSPPRSSVKVLISADRQFPGAEEFVAKVKTLFPAAEELTIRQHAIRSQTVLAELQKGHQIYIFLGHGQANAIFPEQGYIELYIKTADGAPARVRLTVADLKTISWLKAELVMLVGCETAGGKLYRGTGISGLQQEFFALGAKNVLGNLWEADATLAVPQAQEFLMRWVSTGNPAQALQESQKQTMQQLQRHRIYQQAHPYFWGSAVLLTATFK